MCISLSKESVRGNVNETNRLKESYVYSGQGTCLVAAGPEDVASLADWLPFSHRFGLKDDQLNNLMASVKTRLGSIETLDATQRSEIR